ncbi:hypothetical protein C8Q75DRAFT_730408 [Abortiporus biennis]|nr:hypothetical protein C8Q75DRAFT_730408 [Abortiporus biennis]
MASPSSAVPLAFNLDNTLGALLIGLVVAALLWTRILMAAIQIAFLWLLDVLHLAFATHVTYYYLVTKFLNPTGLLSIPWSALVFMMCSTLSDLLVRSCLINRIRRLMAHKNIYIASALFLSNFTVSGFGFALSARAHQVGSPFKFQEIAWLLFTVWSTNVFLDALIAIILCLLLWHMKTGFRRTDSQVEILMRYTIHTGALTSIVAIAMLITYGTMQHNFVFIGIYFTIPKFYFNAMLANLNAGRSLRNETSELYNSVNLPRISACMPSITSDSHVHSEVPVTLDNSSFNAKSSDYDMKNRGTP